MDEVMQIQNICKNFSSGVFKMHIAKAVDDVSFVLRKGETFGLVGNSGCGKTTLSRLITRQLHPSSGRILFEGKDLAGLNREAAKAYHRRVQMIFQNPEASLDPTMKIQDSLLEALAIHNLGENREQRMERIQKVLQQLSLPDYLLNRYPHQISGGEGQRLVICRALLLDPEVLLLDEPTSMLDVSVQASIMNILKDLQQELGLTYLYITHDIELLGWISHRIGVMQAGKLVEEGTRDQIMEGAVHPYTRQLLHSYRHWE